MPSRTVFADVDLDVTTTTEAKLIGASDEEHLRFAQSERRIVVTNDADFVELAHVIVGHSGVAYCAQGRRSTGEIIRSLCLIHDCLTTEEMVGRVEYL